MKRTLTFIFCCLFMLTQISAYAVEKKIYNAQHSDLPRFVLNALGIMADDPTGDFRSNLEVTRWEFAKIICEVLSIPSDSGSNDFLDTSDFQSGASSLASLGYMTGYTDRTFRPDNYITYDEAITVLVKVLGYDIAASENGGYPRGYYTVAHNLGLTKGLNLSGNANRGEVALLVYRTIILPILDVKGRQQIDKTLLEAKMTALSLKRADGKVDAVGKVSIGENVGRENSISIDGKMYNSDGSLAAQDYLGANVDFFYNDSDYSIIAIRKLKDGASVVIDGKDFNGVDGNRIYYYDMETGKKQHADVFGVRVIYNERLVSDAQSAFRNVNGTILLFDYDDDGNYEICFIREHDTFVIDSIDYEDFIITFKDKSFNGISFVKKEYRKEVHLLSVDGREQDITEFSVGDTITVYMSKSGDYAKVFRYNHHIKGIVTEFNQESMVIDHVEYPIARDLSGNYAVGKDDISFDDEKTYYLDMFGKVFYTPNMRTSGDTYGVVAELARERGLDGKYQARIIQGRRPQFVEDTQKNPKSSERFKLSATNVGTVVLSFAKNVTIDGIGFSSDDITQWIKPNDPISYSLNENGEIQSVRRLMQHGEKGVNRIFDYDTRTFGGSAGGAFFIDNSTTFIINPINKAVAENFLVSAEITQGNSVAITGYDVNEKTKIASVAVIDSTREYYSYSTDLNDRTRIGIVTNVVRSYNRFGEAAWRIDGYHQGEVFNRFCIDSPQLNSKVTKLKPGDVIAFFPTNGGGFIGDINIIAKLSEIGHTPTKVIGTGTPVQEITKGKLYDFNESTLLDTSLRASDVIEISSDGTGGLLSVHVVENTVPKTAYYIFDKRTNQVHYKENIFVSTMKNTDSENADDVFVYKLDGEVKIVVFIKGEE